jgi:hypothetical protein
MRTTITLDDELGRQLHDQMRRTGKGFKETLHEILARGLSRSAAPSHKTFQVKSKSMGLRPGIDPSTLHDLDTDLEVDRFLKVTDRLSAEK